MAFLFRVETGRNTAPKFYVKIARCITYSDARVAWMVDPRLPEFDDESASGTLAPDIDITEECHLFESECEAIEFMARHYKSELEKSSQGTS